MPEIKTFADVEAALASLAPVVFVPNLRGPRHMPELMELLGNPQERYQVIHVAGTSGKTSTSYYAAALLKAAGKRVGLNISPHAECINERVQVNMEPLPEQVFCAEFARFWPLIQQSGLALNYFQVITAFAFWEFAQQGVEYAVIEAGIGGLADSTNVVQRADKICIITDIDYGHVAVLGDTLGEIAANKAGIIQLRNAVFCRQQATEILEPVRRRARQQQADLHTIDALSDIPFLPSFQQRNLAMAEAAVQFALARAGHPPLGQRAVARAARVAIPARLETHHLHGKTVILDGAHNPQEMRALAQSVRQTFATQPVAVLFASTRGPQAFYQGMASAVRGLAAYCVITGYPAAADGRFGSVEPQKLLHAVSAQGASAKVVAEPAKALAMLLDRPEPVVLVTGSFYLLNHVRPFLKQLKRPGAEPVTDV